MADANVTRLFVRRAMKDEVGGAEKARQEPNKTVERAAIEAADSEICIIVKSFLLVARGAPLLRSPFVFACV